MPKITTPGQPPIAAPRDHERSPLSQREREIVALMAQGFTNKEMAKKMFISEQTVENHLHNILEKLGISRPPDGEPAAQALLREWHTLKVRAVGGKLA